MTDNLTVARFQERTTVLGPGSRAVVWFHGCSFDCPGCIAAEMNRSSDYESISPSVLADRVLSCPDIEGVTLSGGDPFDQPLSSLLEFLRLLRSYGQNVGVMCYTGRTLDQLKQSANDFILEILAHCDILVDGLYVEALNDGPKWRGSSNQAVHFLTPRHAALKEFVESATGNEIEIVLDSQMRIAITGVPPQGFGEELERQLGAADFHISFGD